MVGPFRSGDARSGEVEIRPATGGPVTTVFVRQLVGESWWVLGSATADLEFAEPATLEVITSPLEVTGRATTETGRITLQLRADGDAVLAGEELDVGPEGQVSFAATLDFTLPDEAGGAVLLTTTDDDHVLAAAVVRVLFGPSP